MSLPAHAAKQPAFSISSRKINGSVLSRSEGTQHLFHACTINDQPHIIYPVGLENIDPATFAQLQTFAHDNRLRLQEERRTNQHAECSNRRRPWLPILLLTISANTAAADKRGTEENWSHTLGLTSQDTMTRLESNDAKKKHTTAPLHGDHIKHYANASLAANLYNSLRNHFTPAVDDPYNMNEELQLLANYYSRFPQVVELIRSLDKLQWQLHFEHRSFRTEVTGSSLSVEKADVFFDPNFGAKLKFQRACEDKLPHCIASPADALLHELLHVKSILNNTVEYIANGGMGGLLYPFEHERKTIEEENDLYRAMTLTDQIPRPIRSEHTGRYILVACSTCIQ